MADNVAITAGSGTTIATDDAGAGGHVQIIKLAISTDGSATAIPADATNGLDVDVTRLPALVAGTANIGDVDVLTLPNVTLAAGTNTNEVVGDVAQDAAVAGNPLLAGGRASTAVPTAMSADGDSVFLWALRTGAVVVNLRDAAGNEVTVGTAGTPSANVNSVQGVAAMYAIAVRERALAVVGGTMTRPANTTAYAANDAVSNNATAGSVTAQTFTLSDTNDDPIILERMRLHTTDTGIGANLIGFRAWLYMADPTTSSGVVGGDNAAFSTKKGSFIGSMSGQFRAFSDGGVAVLVPDEGGRIITKPVSGATTLYVLYQILSAATPSANSTTIIPTLEGIQARA